MKFVIYTLSNPIKNKIFYIGQTSDDLNKRLADHLAKTKSLPQSDKSREILSILEYGFKPVIEEVEELVFENYNRFNRTVVNELENYWIEQFTAWGFNLINIKFNPSKWSKEYKRETFSRRKNKCGF